MELNADCTGRKDCDDASSLTAVRRDSPNVISPFNGSNDDSDFEADSPDLVCTDSDELSTASAEGFSAEQFITFDADICVSLFGDDDTTVGAAYYTIDGDNGDGGDGGRSSEAVSSLFTEVRAELAVFSQEISTVVDEFELDCLAAQAELAGLLGPPQIAPGEPNGAPGTAVAATASGDRAVADVLSMHLPSLGGEILPAVAVVTVNGKTKEAEMPGFLVRTDLKQSSVTIPCTKLIQVRQSAQSVPCDSP